MIDASGFRANVGIVIADGQGHVLWAKRVGGRDAWQFPQGGIKENETPEQALYRELEEEVGLCAEDVELVHVTQGWLRYRLPRRMVRDNAPVCIGQKQKWFLLLLKSNPSRIRFDAGDTPEFDHWRWVSYWHPLAKVIAFKKDVYRRALKELSWAHNDLVKKHQVANIVNAPQEFEGA